MLHKVLMHASNAEGDDGLQSHMQRLSVDTTSVMWECHHSQRDVTRTSQLVRGLERNKTDMDK